MTKRILVGLAGTPYTPVAIRTAVDMARRHGAELTGVTVVDLDRLSSSVPTTSVPDVAQVREQRLQLTHERVSEAVGEFENACAAAGIPHRVLREIGDPFDVLVAASRYHDLTILGIRGIFEFDLGADDPGKTVAKLLGGGVRPILAVGREHWPGPRVLAAYSGSVESARALRQFVQFRLWPVEALRIVTFQSEEPLGQALLRDAAGYCLAHNIEASTEWSEADPREALLPYAARWGADALVLGNSARSLLLRHALGEVALRVMRDATVPLFLSQ